MHPLEHINKAFQYVEKSLNTDWDQYPVERKVIITKWKMISDILENLGKLQNHIACNLTSDIKLIFCTILRFMDSSSDAQV